MANICVGCGKRTRLTWPKGKASFCKMKCAANNFVALVSAGCDYGFCQTCGNESWVCGGCLAKEDEEEDEEDEEDE
tara:strand:+ start:976 stop:1203 length:228 start_codon:yes stop_codon:yes gene_type:complete